MEELGMGRTPSVRQLNRLVIGKNFVKIVPENNVLW